MSPALANDGVLSFVVLLALLLAMMLAAVIRVPPWGGSSEDDARPQPAAPAPARPATPLPRRRPQPGNTATMPLPAGSTAQPRHARHAARHVAGPAPGEGTIPRPMVSSGPPWGPAAKPSGIQ